jgi:hypothetical protein
MHRMLIPQLQQIAVGTCRTGQPTVTITLTHVMYDHLPQRRIFRHVVVADSARKPRPRRLEFV